MADFSEDWAEFFKLTPKPAGYDETIEQLKIFTSAQIQSRKKIVLVSSGGTTVPLESRTVRYIDNFSSGTRGSSSAEYFMKQGYAVIFLHRKGSLEPFKRHFSRINILDIFEVFQDKVTIKSGNEWRVAQAVGSYQHFCDNLFNIPFTTLNDYLHLLRGTAEVLGLYEQHVMFYLAAAVSDFFIPASQMPEHKIQSSEGAIQISLQLVPKMLQPLVSHWAPKAYVVSFKLETDPAILIPKAKGALEKYSHQLVIGNILETRKREVTIVSQEDETPINMSDDELQQDKEIEEKIVIEVKRRHEWYMKNELDGVFNVD